MSKRKITIAIISVSISILIGFSYFSYNRVIVCGINYNKASLDLREIVLMAMSYRNDKNRWPLSSDELEKYCSDEGKKDLKFQPENETEKFYIYWEVFNESEKQARVLPVGVKVGKSTSVIVYSDGQLKGVMTSKLIKNGLTSL